MISEGNFAPVIGGESDSDVVYAQISADASGNTVLMGADGAALDIRFIQDTVCPSYSALISARAVDVNDTTILDRSGKGNNAALGAQCVAATVYAEAGTTGLFSLAASGAANEQSLNMIQPTWNGATQSFVLAMRVKIPAPATDAVALMGTAGSTLGWKLSGYIDGTVRINVYATAGGVFGGASLKAVCDGNEHWLAIIYDVGTTGPNLRIEMDGEKIRGETITAQDYTSASGILRIGGIAATSGAGGKYGDIHALVFDGGIPANIYSALAKLRANPTHKLTSEVV